MGSFSETYAYHDPRFPKVSTSSIQKSELSFARSYHRTRDA